MAGIQAGLGTEGNTVVRRSRRLAVARSVHESSRDIARDIAKTDVYKQSRKDRKKVEMLFAHLKRILKLDRLRLRGLSGANDEFLLARSRKICDEWRSGLRR